MNLHRKKGKGALLLLTLLLNSSTLTPGGLSGIEVVEAFTTISTSKTLSEKYYTCELCEEYFLKSEGGHGGSTGIVKSDIGGTGRPRSRSNSSSNTALYMSSRFNIRNRLVKSITGAPKAQRQQQPPVVVDDLNIDIPRIQVKPRPLVSLDESTGRYIRTNPNEDSTTSTQKNNSNGSSSYSDDDYPQVSGWTYFKDFVYDTIDNVSGLSAIFGMSSNRNSKGRTQGGNIKAPITTPLSSMNNRNLAVAYSDTVEFKTKANSNMNANPLNIMAKQQQQRPQQQQQAPQQLAQQYESSLSASNEDRSDGEDLFKSDVRKSFDAAKDGFYDLFFGTEKAKATPKAKDSAGPSAVPEKLQSKSPLLQKIESSSSSSSSSFEQDSTTFKPLSKPSTNQDETITSITPYLADLDSPNPIKALSAKYAIAAIERKNKRRLQQQAQREAIEDAKRRVYDAIDSVQSLYGAVVDVPRRVEEAAIRAEVAVEQSVQSTKNTVKEVRAIPSKVQKAVEDTVKSVEDTKRAAVNVVEEVKSIPTKVENKVAETKQSIQETKEGVEKVVKKVEDLTFEAKVLAGLEKPKPLPPPPPPPPKTNQEIAMDVAGVVAKTTGKAAVVVGKGTISLTATAAKAAFNAAKEQSQKQKDGKENSTLLSRFNSAVDSAKKKKEAGVKAADAISESSVALEAVETPLTIGEIDPLLELEVADALKSAEDALISAKKEKNNPKTTQTTLQINLALEKARVAAAKARKDAEDLELMLEKRKELFFKP